MKSKYFTIEELVSENVYKKYGNKSWEFIDSRLIETIDKLREVFDKPITINNWKWGGNLKQRGLRANKDEIVVNKTDYYVSQHCLGKAVDFNVKGLSPEEVYNFILEHKDEFPYITRIENINKTPSWTHIDLSNTESKELIIF